MSDQLRVMVPMPTGSRTCQACAGTGQPSPWEYDHYVWLEGVPHAVCGACRGAGNVGRFGFRLSARKVAGMHRRMRSILFGGQS